jgi:hypothetical protein
MEDLSSERDRKSIGRTARELQSYREKGEIVMSHSSVESFGTVGTRRAVDHSFEHHGPSYQAYQILHWGFVAAPVIAGADKFVGMLANWDVYLAPQIARLLPMSPHTFMLIAGAIEVLAGLVVAVKPRIGAYVVAAWLVGIIVNLLLWGGYYDIALRDFGLFLGALALGRLSALYDRPAVRVGIGR